MKSAGSRLLERECDWLIKNGLPTKESKSWTLATGLRQEETAV